MTKGPDPTEPLKVVPAGWITKPEALKRTGRSLKRFEQAVAAAGIPKRYVEVPGKRATPIYRAKDIDALVKRPPANPTKSLVRRPQALTPAALQRMIAATTRLIVPVDRMHLVSMKQAHALGYPWNLLREWKNAENPPGIRHGRGAFKFSVWAMAERLRRLVE